jgi:hypothetical protein
MRHSLAKEETQYIRNMAYTAAAFTAGSQSSCDALPFE